MPQGPLSGLEEGAREWLALTSFRHMSGLHACVPGPVRPRVVKIDSVQFVPNGELYSFLKG